MTRTESDSMGTIEVPAEALYGAQTARALRNFPISRIRFSRPFLRALGLIKKNAAATNASLKQLDEKLASATQRAAQEVIDGELDTHLVVDVFQTGSGTSTNMNVNEVIANRATELLGGQRGQWIVHPNDHVNLGQSSNDVIPSAIHIAALEGIEGTLIPALRALQDALSNRATAFNQIMKIGRTHLQDATPIRLGQEFSGYASQVAHGIARLHALKPHLTELALGGTAVGTGLNTHPEFARCITQAIAKETGLDFREAANHFEAQSARDACVEASGALKTVALSLVKVSNDIRWLGSGPRCGFGELKLPALQPGSSIMPGKVNPVLSEMLMQVGAQVVGNDSAICTSNALGSNFELNVAMPVIAHNLLESIELLANGTRTFSRMCVGGLTADKERCEAGIEQSLAMCTALAPTIGYDAAARIAKAALESGRTVRDVAKQQSGLDEKTINDLLDPRRQTGPLP